MFMMPINIMKTRRIKLMSLCGAGLVFIYHFFGVGDYIGSRSFEKDFDYPLNIDVRHAADEILCGKKITIQPINLYPYKFLTNSGKCRTLERIDLFIVVKSAIKNFDRRTAIRNTYGQEYRTPGKIIKTMFFLGIESHKTDLQRKVDREIETFKDIIQVDFHDTYFNNTIKTVMSFRWVFEHCPVADYYLFTDDDMYISVDNLLNYISDQKNEKQNNVPTCTLNSKELYAGYVFQSAPHRHQISKWRVSLEEYPWDRWPTYVTAGAYVISNKSMKYIYIASLYVKHFRFDDIYLAIVSKKLGLQLTHCPNFYFYKKQFQGKESYENVIASHGYSDPDELTQVWREMNPLSRTAR